MSTSDGLTIVGFVLTLGIAIVGWVRLGRSDQRARDANDLADKANQHASRAIELAEAAEARAARLETLTTERRDVRWSRREFDAPEGRLGVGYFNAGADTAFAVELQAREKAGEWSRPPQQHGQVEPGDRIAIDLTAEVGERRRRHETESSLSGLALDFPPWTEVEVTVTWRSPSGVPGVETFKVTL